MGQSCRSGARHCSFRRQSAGRVSGGAGAQTTLSVAAAKQPWSFSFANAARESFDNFHYQLGGDHALYYNQNLSEMLPTAYSSPNPKYMPLEVAIDDSIGGAVKFTTKEGELSLDEYVVLPNHRVQGVLMVHRGRIVYQAYPGMNPMDRHVWMSPGKATVGLILGMLEAEGKIDLSKPVVEYVPELAGTNWDDVPLLAAANMSTGLALEETLESIIDPSSIIVRFFSAEFGSPNPMTGEMENWLDILKEAEKLEGEEPGEVFRYFSAVTQVSVLMAEKIDDKTWADLFQERVWGKIGQGIYIDPARDFVGVYYSTNGYIPPYGEDKMPGFLRRAAKYLAGE